MAHVSDWVELGKSTINSITSDDMASLYVREWQETRKILIAEHREAIDGEPRRVRRFLRTHSAILFGLTKRLAPTRRVIFLLCFLYFFACLGTLFARMNNAPVSLFVEVGVAFLVMTLLLAMELIDKIKFRDELVLARELQSSLIPKVPPRTDSYDIAAFHYIANTVGGDIYDFVPLPDGRLAVLFGDASGHGMAAGLVMAVAHASFRTQLDIDPAPAAIIASLNRILCRTGSSRSFFSCCYLLFEPDGGFTGIVAGHPQVLRIATDGRVVERLGQGSYPLGIKSNLTWEPVAGVLGAGERLMLHSDGLTESRDRDDREFGEAFLESIAGWDPEGSLARLIETVVREWRLFTRDRPADDDVSLAVIGFAPQAESGLAVVAI